MSESFPEKYTLSEAELVLVIAFPYIVKGPLLGPMNLALKKQILYQRIIKRRVLSALPTMS